MSAAPEPLAAKLADLRHRVTELGPVVVAFSGGVDSAFLLKVAADALGERCHAVTAVSVTMARSEVICRSVWALYSVPLREARATSMYLPGAMESLIARERVT